MTASAAIGPFALWDRRSLADIETPAKPVTEPLVGASSFDGGTRHASVSSLTSAGAPRRRPPFLRAIMSDETSDGMIA
jgi:hypothetical protein